MKLFNKLLVVTLMICVIQGVQAQEKKEYYKGQNYYDNNKLNEATKIYEGINTSESIYNQGAIYYKNNKLDKAQELLDKAKEADNPSVSSRAYESLADIKNQKNEYKEAIKQFQKALIKDPNNKLAQKKLVETMRKLKKQQQQQSQNNNDQNQGDNNQPQDQQNQQNKSDSQNQQQQNQQGDKNQDQNQQQQNGENQQDPKDGNKSLQNPSEDPTEQNQGRSKEESENMLRALENEEKETQRRALRRKIQSGEKVQESRNQEKDW